MRITPITRVSSCNIELNYEEMVMLRALLARARKSREDAARYYNPFDYGQSETATAPFLHDLHHKLIELTGAQHE